MHEKNDTPVNETPTEKRAWQTPAMEVFDVQTLTAFGGPGVYNPGDITTYQS